MQNTRLNTIIERTTQQFARWVQNPWRRLSLLIISLLFGNFLASSIATSTGQRAELDITVALVLLGVTEVVSWLNYSSAVNRILPTPAAGAARQRPLWLGILNNLKLGLVYGLFVEAFKLGS